MEAIEALRQQFPDHSKDIKINVQKVLTDSKLTAPRMWGTALACAVASRDAQLAKAVETDALAAGVSADVLDDARAAASLMAMNNVYYRFKHFMGDDEIEKIPARLRMQRIARPKGEKVDFELFCLAVSTINGCEVCVRSHAKVVLDGGLSKEEVAESVRIAATFEAAAVALSQA
ncbi:MAG: carboxymuconolactone decarboxylase family protein [Myxococcota bacterium]